MDKALAVEKITIYSYKPNVFVLKAKYELLHKKQERGCRKITIRAIMFASVLEDSVLEKYKGRWQTVYRNGILRHYFLMVKCLL